MIKTCISNQLTGSTLRMMGACSRITPSHYIYIKISINKWWWYAHSWEIMLTTSSSTLFSFLQALVSVLIRNPSDMYDIFLRICSSDIQLLQDFSMELVSNKSWLNSNTWFWIAMSGGVNTLCCCCCWCSWAVVMDTDSASRNHVVRKVKDFFMIKQ